MRRHLRTVTAVATVATCMAAMGALPSGAVVRSAADLAADCNDDGQVAIAEDTQFIGGSAEIWGAEVAPGVRMCLVDIVDDGVSLAFVNVNLRAKGDVSFNVGQSSEQAQTSVKVLNSTIDMHPAGSGGGFVSIKSGCCAGEPSEQSARVSVVGSTLRGTSIELGASLAASNGRLTLTGNSVTATGDSIPGSPDIEIRASVGGTGPSSGGQIRALRNRFAAPDGLRGHTGLTGNTWFVANDFRGVSGGVVLTTGAGGSCTSFLNNPAVACT